jgi:hypothetical protein
MPVLPGEWSFNQWVGTQPRDATSGRSRYVTIPGRARHTRGMALIAGRAVMTISRTMESLDVVAGKSAAG